MTEKLLIINADDYGLTPDVSRGIRYAHANGLVTSTTALMNSVDIARDLEVACRETPNMGFGVHLNLTLGRPLLPTEAVPSIVDQEGRFMSLGFLKLNISQIDPTHVYKEWKAQIEKMISLGITPDHLDSHHHVSYRNRALYRITLQLASEYGLPVRSSPAYLASEHQPIDDLQDGGYDKYQPLSPDALEISFYNDGVNIDHLKAILYGLAPGVMELMTHPAFDSSNLHDLSSYNAVRELELEILASPEARKTIEILGITLTTFKVLHNID